MLGLRNGGDVDRLIVAQAISEKKMSIVTRDTIIPKYPVNVIW